jgi:hypothetical protein
MLIRDGGVIAAGYDANLDELRDISEHADRYLSDLESRERARTGLPSLKVGYNRVHGYYIELSRGQAGKAPDDYQRRQTLKGAERYITPELKEFEGKVLSARDRALAREKELYAGLLETLMGVLIDHRPEHGRQEHLHAPERADRAAGAASAASCRRRRRRRSGPIDRIFTRIGAATTWPRAVDLHGRDDRNREHPAQRDRTQPGADGRDRPRHQHLRRPALA